MGMYTELIFSAELDGDMPVDIVKTIKHMCGQGDKPDVLPNHELFETDRWSLLLTGSSYYFVDSIVPVFRFDDICEDWRLTTRSNIKNYDNEIQKFLDWIKPYIRDGSGERGFYAIVCYEEQAEPTIYYLDK